MFFEKKVYKKFGRSKKNSTFATALSEMLPVKEKKCGNSSVGRARPCQGRGRGFEPRLPLIF